VVFDVASPSTSPGIPLFPLPPTPYGWGFNGEMDLSAAMPGLMLPIYVGIDGVGLTPEQILPDFSSVTGGEVVVDLALIAPGEAVLADVTAVSITPIVPEPSAAVLVGMSLLGIASWRRLHR
jgi:hypothetical protein